MKDSKMLYIVVIVCMITASLGFISLIVEVTPHMRNQLIDAGCLTYNQHTGKLEVVK
jgi:hypothetical protein